MKLNRKYDRASPEKKLNQSCTWQNSDNALKVMMKIVMIQINVLPKNQGDVDPILLTKVTLSMCWE